MVYRDFMFTKEKLPLMNEAMDAYALRQQTIAKNIANINSPHYRPENVKFEELFHHAQVSLSGTKTSEKHIPVGNSNKEYVEGEKAEAAVPSAEVYFSGETHVNIDKEMSAMAQNQIRFRFTSRMMRRYFDGLQTSIREAIR